MDATRTRPDRNGARFPSHIFTRAYGMGYVSRGGTGGTSTQNKPGVTATGQQPIYNLRSIAHTSRRLNGVNGGGGAIKYTLKYTL